ncbi:hypothetical protein BDZ85DRAFT_35485 [Elsinoe ampelina]|uniref:Rhodopsin domain-containing protein n=1 Tax=Elsinoe ampelina TaxID=302913 RepID=A0A6A6G2L2_9PEZI|nr:hypothetical protein BDZ85DRAFT_35485 [Elsinoe ampelina]
MSFTSEPLTTPFEPPGVKDGGRTILLVSWPATALAIAIAILRCIYAGSSKGRPRWDCVWAVVAVVVGVASQILMTIACIYGIGQHLWELGSFTTAAYPLRIYWASAMAFIWAMAFAKLAIVSLLFSVWCPWQTKRRFFLHFMWVSTVLVTAVQTALSLSQCTPRQAIFDYSMTTADCRVRFKALHWGYFSGAWGAVTDIVLALYSILIIQDIKASMRTKIGFCLLMGGGFISAIASVIRTYYLYRVSLSFDTTYEVVETIIWGSIELWLICILSSIPPLKHFFLRIFGWRSGSRSSSNYPSAATVRSGDTKKILEPLPTAGDGLVTENTEYQEQAADSQEKETKRNDWLGGITMRNSLWVTSRPATRPSTRVGLGNDIV